MQQANPAAAELLELCSFLAPDRIPEELLRNGATYWSTSLQQAIVDPLTFQHLIADLLKFSLVKRLAETHMLSIHRLVQTVQRDMMTLEIQRQWAERILRAVDKVFPDNPKDITSWSQCSRYLDQVQVCNYLIEQYMLPLIEAAHLLNRAGLYLSEHASYTVAEPLLERALEIHEQILGPSHPDTIADLLDLGWLYIKQANYKEAEPLFQRAMILREQVLGTAHPETASSYDSTGWLYHCQGNDKAAEALLRQAVAIRKQVLGLKHPDTAKSLLYLGLICDAQGGYKEAEQLCQQAIEIYEQASGEASLDIGRSLGVYTLLLLKRGKIIKAARTSVRVLKVLGLRATLRYAIETVKVYVLRAIWRK